MNSPQTEDVRQGISVIWENLQCPICLDLLVMPVSTKCGHQFCTFCMMRLLERSKTKEARCPVCTMKVIKRTLQENPGFQRLVEGLQYLVQSYEFDTCTNYFSGTQRKQQKSIETGNLHYRKENKLSSEVEKTQHNDLSPSSSVAAKDKFEQLMDFENSLPMEEEEEVDISKLTPKCFELCDNGIITLEKRKVLQGPRFTHNRTSKDELDLPRRGSVRELEEQVFGTVYKRDRKTSRHSPNTKLSLKTYTGPNSLCLAEKKKREMTEINNKEASNEQMDVEEPKELDVTELQKKTVGLNICKSGQLVVSCEEHEKGVIEYLEKKQEGRIKNRAVFEMPVKRLGTKLMSEMQVDFQDLNKDSYSLNENKNNKWQNKTLFRKNNGNNAISLSQRKEAKCSKSLGTDNSALDKNLVRNFKTIEADVHIETFLGNEEPQCPDTLSAKRSLKLQLFTEVVQGTQCRKRSKQVHKDYRSGSVLAPENKKANDTIDHEQNTEQLLRTLKTAKRKSFHLDSPNATFSGFRNRKNDTPSNVFEPMPSEKSQLKNSRSFGSADSTSVFQLPSKSSYLGDSPVHTSMQNSMFTDNSKVVDSILLFPVSNVFEDEPQNQSCTAAEEKQRSKTTQSDPKTSESSSKNQGPVAQSDVVSLGNFCHSSGNMMNSCPQSLESSMTPDGLMVGDTGPVANGNLHKVKENSIEGVSLPNKMKKKRRAQRLYSSDSELSSGEDGLLSLPQILKRRPLELQSYKEPLLGSAMLNKKGQQFDDKRKNSGLNTLSQCSSSFDQPESWTECQESVSAPGQNDVTETLATLQDSNVSVLLHKDDCLSESQGSVDLFGTQEEYAVDGLSGDVKLSVDSFQYEVINTQQKVEMQKELLRLEKMMVLVSEALCKKSDCCSEAGNTGHSSQTLLDQHSGTECMQEVCKGKKMERDCSGDLETVQLKAISSKAQAKKEQYSARGGTQSLSNGLSSQMRVHCWSGVKAANSKQTQKPADWHEEKGVQRKTSPALMKINGTGDIGTSCGVAGLVASGLTANEMSIVKKFARKIGCSLTKQMTPNTTHIIIKTDRFLVCERTLKYFQGIAERKWVVSYQWVYESFKQGKVLDEVPFEVCGDVVSGHSHSGPLKARKTSDDNLLLKGYEICFHGSFTHMSKGQMEMMVKMCGASVVTDPFMFSMKGKCQLMVVQPSSADDYELYKALHQKATVVSRSWLLDSIATYTLQSPDHYRP